MTKREIIAAVLLALLIALSVYNILSIDALTGDIGIALSKSQSAAEKLDFKAARGYLTEALERWLSDSTADAFYDLQQVLMQEDITACAAAYSKLKYHLASIDQMEHLSLGSIL